MYVSHRSLMGNVNYFGGPGDVCAKNVEKLQILEHENPDAMFVFLSDIWLNKLKVMDVLNLTYLFVPDCILFKVFILRLICPL